MKNLKILILLILATNIFSCKENETDIVPTKTDSVVTVFDLEKEIIKSEWSYISSEQWLFLPQNKIRATNNSGKILNHSYSIIKDSFILTTNYLTAPSKLYYPNLKLSNDTVYWRSFNTAKYNIFLIRRK